MASSPCRNTSTSPGPPCFSTRKTISATLSTRLARSPSASGGSQAQLDGIHRGVDADDGAAVEVVGKHLDVDGGGGDDHPEVGPPGQHPLQEPEDEVDVEAPLVRLVHDDHGVGREVPPALHLLQQYAVGHDLDDRRGVGVVIEAHLVPDRPRDGRADLAGDVPAHRDRGDAPGLRDAHDAAPRVARLVKDQGDLRGLARAGGALDHHHLVGLERLQDPVPLLVDGQAACFHQILACTARGRVATL